MRLSTALAGLIAAAVGSALAAPSAELAKRACAPAEETTLKIFALEHRDGAPILSMTFCTTFSPTKKGNFTLSQASTPSTTFFPQGSLPVQNSKFIFDLIVIHGETKPGSTFDIMIILYYEGPVVRYSSLGYYYANGVKQPSIHSLTIGDKIRPRWPGRG
ncbi:uncharacterized protein L969DRAFT_48633 [Mixia osmundae IAM 14324]|uniref:Uncharacterized protein n=1 Tax=Mixia osmundae (strain CBS 9802 / IAM 14324 / JCM 22182 / KY 12970) TaxID=764103 RepID=G7DVY6_MIXOS|nr:uncharacterized protein L969DRAFT_48633 [Mixia osmundae IAM 14324]KEI39573.1 hypothetical protein L969DRAFT_48633 [Mixia osmundae IAM 14324]GAA94746.1 hypothetical protein E5Q_01400 [Mixia osmundae IAM 14324]